MPTHSVGYRTTLVQRGRTILVQNGSATYPQITP